MSSVGDENLAYGSPIELLRAPAAEYDAAGDERMVQRLGSVAALISALLASVMLLAWAPDRTLGEAGWGVAALAIVSDVVLGVHVRHTHTQSARFSLRTSLVVIVGLGLLQWLSGGLAQYSVLILLPLVFIAASQPPRRVAPALVLALLALLPGLAARDFSSQAVVANMITVVLWLCLVGMALFWTAGVRWQRLALHHSENRAHHRALHDSVTGLGNRRKLLSELEAVLADGTPTVLALFDLNGFKTYNDAFGHPAGDLLLERLGAKLHAAVKESGSAYRMGGDEFVVLVAAGVTETVVAAGRSALSESGQGFAITAAGGAVALPQEAKSASDSLRLADQRMYAEKHQRRAGSLADGTQMLMAVLQERYPELGEHSGAVSRSALDVGRRMGMARDELEQLRLAAELHDIGKLAIPDAILGKPGRLTDDEWAFVRRHPVTGQRILSRAPALAPVASIVRSCHEHMDGAGYPDGRRASEIPLQARIVAVCDAYHAMTSDRPHQRAVGKQAAVEELRRCSSSQFDPAVVEAFIASLSERRPVAPVSSRTT